MPYLLSTLFLAGCAFTAGVASARWNDRLLVPAALRVVGLAGTVLLAGLVGALSGPAGWRLAASLPVFGYAPFAMGSVTFAEESRTSLLLAVTDIAALTALTAVGTPLNAPGGTVVNAASEAPLASLALLAAYAIAALYVGVSRNCRRCLPLVLGLAASVVFALSLAEEAPVARLLALSPLLLLASTTEHLVRPGTVRSGSAR